MKGEAAGQGKQPNIVIVMTDDQEVASLRDMPTVRKTLAEKGTTFENAFASYPLCCPSRVSFQTGQFAHNHGVLDNHAPTGGYGVFDSAEALPVWLQRAGYETAHVGKYMNDYTKDDDIPPGWDRWFGEVEPSSRYFKVHVNDQGTFTKFAKNDPDEYSTDLFTDRAVEFIEAQGEREPFYLSVGYVAPHVGRSFEGKGDHCGRQGPEPAPRHLGDFEGRRLPRGPAFNEDDVTDKPAAVRAGSKLNGKELERKTDKYQCRLESLQSVDEGVGQIVSALGEGGELDDTYVFYVSDNGFIQGDHRIRGGKIVPYEGAIRIPMIVRGPRVGRGETSGELVSNVDFVPTLLELAGATPQVEQDGRSFAAAMHDPETNDGRAVLIESARPPDLFAGVRTHRYLYVERDTGESELYDMRKDPHQLENIRVDPAYLAARAALIELLDRLRECAGAECRTDPDLKLEAKRPAGQRVCASGKADLRITGSDAELVASTRLRIARELVTQDGAGPWRTFIDGRRRSEDVAATAELIDGRLARLAAPLAGCG